MRGLTVIGDNRSYPHEELQAIVAAEGLNAQVTILPYLSDAGSFQAVRTREGFCAVVPGPEGFGHPPLEALGAGVPSVLFDTEVAREVYGEAAVYVRVGDIAGITSALDGLLFDEDGARA